VGVFLSFSSHGREEGVERSLLIDPIDDADIVTLDEVTTPWLEGVLLDTEPSEFLPLVEMEEGLFIEDDLRDFPLPFALVSVVTLERADFLAWLFSLRGRGLAGEITFFLELLNEVLGDFARDEDSRRGSGDALLAVADELLAFVVLWWDMGDMGGDGACINDLRLPLYGDCDLMGEYTDTLGMDDLRLALVSISSSMEISSSSPSLKSAKHILGFLSFDDADSSKQDEDIEDVISLSDCTELLLVLTAS